MAVVVKAPAYRLGKGYVGVVVSDGLPARTIVGKIVGTAQVSAPPTGA
jgi:hypothetical protein